MAEVLRASERRFRSLVENVGEIVSIHDTDGTIRYDSPAVTTVLGYSADELLGRKACELIHPEDCSRILTILNSVVENPGNHVSYTLRFRHKDGSWRTFDGVMTNLLEHPEVAGLVATSTDVTLTRQTEARLRQAQKMEAVGRLTGGIAHDFNNMLAVIRGRAEIALADLDESSPVHEDVVEIAEAAERAANLTRQLLAFSRQQILEPKMLQLNEVITGLEKMLRRTIGEQIEFVTALHPDLGHIEADPSQIEQILMNLAINARDAMPAGGKLITETKNVELTESLVVRYRYEVAPGSYVQLSVSDTGIGIPADVRERIFDPFFYDQAAG
jgi:PAS domain S-box-containing protein